MRGVEMTFWPGPDTGMEAAQVLCPDGFCDEHRCPGVHSLVWWDQRWHVVGHVPPQPEVTGWGVKWLPRKRTLACGHTRRH